MTVFPPNLSGMKTPDTLQDSVSYLALKSLEMQQLTVQISWQVNALLHAKSAEELTDYAAPTQEAVNDDKAPIEIAA